MTNFRQTASFSHVTPDIAPGGETRAPEWVELFPAASAGKLVAQDGRHWDLPDPETVVAAFRAGKRDLPFDYEHATELLGPKGHPAPAVGWLKDVAVRAGALWGKVEWTEDGAKAVASRAYRFLSPAFFATKKVGGTVLRLTSVGLTNNPAFTMTALARAQEGDAAAGEEEITMTKAIAQALGLKDDASEADCVARIGAIKTDATTALARAESPSVEKFVARSEHDALIQTCSTLRTENDKLKSDETDKTIGAAVDKAIADGFVPPAIKDSELALCRAIGTDKYAERLKALKPVITPGEGATQARVEEKDGALTIEEKAMCRSLGISEDDFAKERAAERESRAA